MYDSIEELEDGSIVRLLALDEADAYYYKQHLYIGKLYMVKMDEADEIFLLYPFEKAIIKIDPTTKELEILLEVDNIGNHLFNYHEDGFKIEIITPVNIN